MNILIDTGHDSVWAAAGCSQREGEWLGEQAGVLDDTWNGLQR